MNPLPQSANERVTTQVREKSQMSLNSPVNQQMRLKHHLLKMLQGGGSLAKCEESGCIEKNQAGRTVARPARCSKSCPRSDVERRQEDSVVHTLRHSNYVFGSSSIAHQLISYYHTQNGSETALVLFFKKMDCARNWRR